MYIKVEKAGVNFKARCPFHHEKSPSFFLSPSRNTFYCFGCGAKGDIFEFVERFEGLDFLGSMKLLAEKAGVTISNERGDGGDEKKLLFEVLELATIFFEQNLEENEKAQAYLTERGLTEETIKKFRLGYAPASWRALSEHLVSKGVDLAIIEKAGLSKPGNHGAYDRFRGRIMFPIQDGSGRVVAYSGRIFDTTLEGEGVTPAKYVNSPETPLFHKSHILYGFDKAKEGIRKWTFAIVVEGQMDLLMSHQAGFTNTVALSGTALTEEQLTLLGRLTERLVLALDADVAGLSASGKSASLSLSKGFDVKVALLLGGKDPAEIVKEDPEHYKNNIRGAKHIIEFYLEVLKDKNPDPRSYKLSVTKAVLPFVLLVQNAVDRAHFIGVVALHMGVPQRAIEEELMKLRQAGLAHPQKEVVLKVAQEAEIEKAVLLRKDRILLHLLGLLVSRKKGNEELYEKTLSEIELLIGKETLTPYFEGKILEEASFTAELMNDTRELSHIVKQLTEELALEGMKEKSVLLQEAIRRNETEGDAEALLMAMKEYQTLAKEIQKEEQKISAYENPFTQINNQAPPEKK